MATIERHVTKQVVALDAITPCREAAKVMRAIELMGQRVLPHFHAKYGRS